jgi:hypothetical protein
MRDALETCQRRAAKRETIGLRQVPETRETERERYREREGDREIERDGSVWTGDGDRDSREMEIGKDRHRS